MIEKNLISGAPVSAAQRLPARGAAAEATTAARDAVLRQTAKEFESAFVAQTLLASGLARALSANAGFGGEAYTSFLIEKYAQGLSEKGDFGLAESVYNQLKREG